MMMRFDGCSSVDIHGAGAALAPLGPPPLEWRRGTSSIYPPPGWDAGRLTSQLLRGSDNKSPVMSCQQMEQKQQLKRLPLLLLLLQWRLW